MPGGPHLRPAVLAARERLAQGREKLREQHGRGSPGVQVCALLTDLLDAVVLDLYRTALADLGDPELDSQVVLVPNGGYGRRDVAPFSDVDLLLLHAPGRLRQIKPLAARLLQDLGDSGLELGFSVRTIRDACRTAVHDATVFTSLAESRFLAGNPQLFANFMWRFRRIARWRSHSLIHRIEAARREERQKHGDTAYVLRPNIKRSRGGLRDLQMVRWIGFARYGESDPEQLVRLGVLMVEDHRALQQAREFFLRLRNEMHFHAARAHDVLDRDEQLRLAGLYGFEGDDGLRPVERFMRQYFDHTSAVRYAATHFLASAKVRWKAVRWLLDVWTHQVDREFRVGREHIAFTRQGLRRLPGNLAQMLRLMELSSLYGVRIDHATWRAIREEMLRRESVELTPEAAERFLALMSHEVHLPDLLRRLHQLRVLEKIVPPLAHARNLVQFNEYHKYTVDEHSFLAVESATQFQQDPGPLGTAYRSLREKRTLHLALLMHDLGKGYPEDHSEIGAQLAEATARQLRLAERETEVLSFLVRKHLVMSHTAQQKDLNDESVIVQFAVEVGSIEILQLLYVLTCADLQAVGPGILNQWKLELITELYDRTREHLAGESTSPVAERRLQALRGAVRNQIGADADSQWWERQIAQFPTGYLRGESPDRIVEELRQLRQLPSTEVITWARYDSQREAMEYTVGAHDEITPGVFHKLTGVLSSRGMQILSAEIHTLADNLILDRFFVHDLDFTGPPPQERRDEVRRALAAALTHQADAPPTFRRIWQPQSNTANLTQLPTQVRFDNSTSARCTIVTVLAYDRLGLLYAIAGALFELGLSVQVAKIGTYLDQVVDVFYVVDPRGSKVEDESQLERIRERLLLSVAAAQCGPPFPGGIAPNRSEGRR